MIYTHNNNELRIADVKKKVHLKGWVQKTRNLGGLIFIDLRDKEGITQILVKPDNAFYKQAQSIKNEYVIDVEGKVLERESKNKKLKTGEIEIEVSNLVILNTSETPPIIVADDTDALEDTRLKYRYLDLRRPIMQKNMILRHKVTKSVRDFLDSEGFIDFDTPILNKSTPEGARDYLVPSRIQTGSFYALPQSPQIFKQLLMVSGFEKYYQLAKCFRDEDLRADRQPEFTQIDIETSFLSMDEILKINERMFVKIMKDVMKIKLKAPFKRLTYDYAMEHYGSDKPDLRYDMQIIDVSDIFKNSKFTVFNSTIKKGGFVNMLAVKGAASKYSRKQIDILTDFVKKYRAKGLAWLKFTDEGLTGPISKFLSDDEKSILIKEADASVNDLLLFVADKYSVCKQSLGSLRTHLGKELNLIPKGEFNFLWITEFPLFEYNEDDGRYYSLHHPFTMPMVDNIEMLKTNPEKCYSYAYDLVLNGYELGSGSIRIHNQEMQTEIFDSLNISKEEQEAKFGFLLEALKYGTPPHGGIGLGLERICMCLLETDNMKDVVAFPKTQSAQCKLSSAPSRVSQEQLNDLKIKI